jgi:tetratricopeptide (TPR) repeat protein
MILRWLIVMVALLSPAIARAEWFEASSDHFVVYLEGTAERAERFASDLERFDRSLRIARGIADSPPGAANRVTVYVVDDTDTTQALSTRGVAGFYIGRAGGPMAVVPRHAGDERQFELSGRQVLHHEYAHHFMYTSWPGIAFPSWFIEGFAEFHATSVIDREGGVVLGAPPQYRAHSIMAGNWLPLNKMLIAETLKLNEVQREALYGRGWLLTHYLNFNRARTAQLTDYFKALNAGKPPTDAATAFGDLKTLDRELERYKRTRFELRRVPPQSMKLGAIKVRQLRAGEAALMDIRIRSKVGVNKKTAAGVYARAARASAPYPNDPAVQIVLAEAAYDAGDYSVAEAAADRALAADPKAIDAYVYKAMSRMGVARKAGDLTPGTWSAIRKIIATANRLDPDDPEPHILFFRSFGLARQAPTANAKTGLMYAFTLAPYDINLRMNAALVQLQDGKLDAARAMLRPVAYNPHGGGHSTAAAEIIARIDSGDRAAIDALLERQQGEDEDQADGDGGAGE